MVEIGATPPHDHSEDGAETINPKVLHGQVNGAHQDFPTLQDAVDWANGEGYQTILLPPGTYDSVDLHVNQFLFGLAGMRGNAEIRSTGDHAVDCSGTGGNQEIMNVSIYADTSDGVSGTYDAVHVGGTNNVVVNCCALYEADRHAVYFDANDCIVSNCYFGAPAIDGDSVNMGANSVRCNVIGNVRVGTITNGGTGNNVSGNT